MFAQALVGQETFGGDLLTTTMYDDIRYNVVQSRAVPFHGYPNQ